MLALHLNEIVFKETSAHANGKNPLLRHSNSNEKVSCAKGTEYLFITLSPEANNKKLQIFR